MGIDSDSIWRVLAVGLVIMVVMVSTGLGVVGTLNVEAVNHDACTQTNTLRIAVTQVLHQSEQGLPSNAYYRAHPDELRAAQRAIAYDLSLFKPVNC